MMEEYRNSKGLPSKQQQPIAFNTSPTYRSGMFDNSHKISPLTTIKAIQEITGGKRVWCYDHGNGYVYHKLQDRDFSWSQEVVEHFKEKGGKFKAEIVEAFLEDYSTIDDKYKLSEWRIVIKCDYNDQNKLSEIPHMTSVHSDLNNTSTLHP